MLFYNGYTTHFPFPNGNICRRLTNIGILTVFGPERYNFEMGSEGFQSEYIEYLQKKNAELLNRLAQMKEIYDNKIFSKNLNQHFFISTLVDVLNVCTAIPEEIDTLFDKMSEAMSVLINVLSRKSTLMQLGEKISNLLNPPSNEDLIDVQSAEENSSSKTSRKAGTVKVSPMINGHIISTEPRIYLNRVSGNYIPNRSDSHRLSPILEVSPDATSDSSNINHQNFKELRVISERLNLDPGTYKYINQDSPKGRFKGTKIWKKSLSSNRQNPKSEDGLFLQSDDNIEKIDAKEIGRSQSSEHDVDPMEGPSWLYDEGRKTRSNPESYIDFRRRRHRYARIFDKNKDDITYCENEVLDSDNMYDNIPSGKPCDNNAEDSKSSDTEISESVIETDEEFLPCGKKKNTLKKRKKCDSEENFPNDKARKRRSSSRFSGKKKKKESDISDSSYEGDNEENFSEKWKHTRTSNNSNRSKSLFEEDSANSAAKETKESEYDYKETEAPWSRKSESLKLTSYDMNELIKDALGKEAQIFIEDCMKKKESSRKVKYTRSRSNASRSKSNEKNTATNYSNDEMLRVTDIDRNSISNSSNNNNNNNLRSKRKAAPISLKEPKLNSKLRRN